jgi:hypothetical protein|tara:strand:+ start:811 stop:1029 length:219 start_codon:yes stop_codon:yes gene_type:complete
MSNQAPTITFNVTIDQANAILNILGNAPFVQSANLINLLQEQAGPQVRALQIEEAKTIAAQGDTVEEGVSVQ